MAAWAVHIPPLLTTAASLDPSAEQAMESQNALGALVFVHVAPESVEMIIPLDKTVAAILVPSAEQAMDMATADNGEPIHVTPELVEVKTEPLPSAASLVP